MSTPPRITLAKARRLALQAQGLDGSFSPDTGPDGTAAVFGRLGYVQIDTISVIARAHHHILWSRQKQYGEADLDHLLAVDRRVFEGWSHAASFLPMEDYRFYAGAMHAHTRRQQTIDWIAANRKIVDHVRDRIRAEGPLGTSDFADEGGNRGPWWDWKPAKGALELLLSSGELMISERRQFQRLYDLTERVLPRDISRDPASPQERARWALDRAMDQHGVASVGEMRIWNRDNKSLRQALDEALDEGRLSEVRIAGDEGPPLYVRSSSLQKSMRVRQGQAHLLSPFDNLVIRRPWLSRLFDFDYTIECYVPAKKRVYGYFCLPVLWGDRFIGRLDAKAERKKGSFAVRRLTLEPDLTADQIEAVLPALADQLNRFGQFNLCPRIRIDAVRPNIWRSPLRKALKQIPG